VFFWPEIISAIIHITNPDLGLNTDIPAGIRMDRLRVPPRAKFCG
jgi:hypothetical protein